MTWNPDRWQPSSWVLSPVPLVSAAPSTLLLWAGLLHLVEAWWHLSWSSRMNWQGLF